MSQKLKLPVFCMALFILAAVAAPTLQAGDRWVEAYVTAAGPGWGKYYIGLRDANGSNFPQKWFIPAPGQEKEMLATALTALANGKRVAVFGNVDVENGYIGGIFMVDY
jgi:hypothetical protein